MHKTIFYSWQADLPNASNRGFIETALKKAVKNLVQKPGFGLLEVDQATRGNTGAPDIAATLFKKVRCASVLVADISIVRSGVGERLTPNPNVLIEVGWGAAHLGWDYVILCLNEHFGRVEELPFDLRARRCERYYVDPDTDGEADTRAELAKRLESGLRDIIVGTPLGNSVELIRIVRDGNPDLLETLLAHQTTKVLLAPDQYKRIQALLRDTSLHEYVGFESNGIICANDSLGMRSGFVMQVNTEFLEFIRKT